MENNLRIEVRTAAEKLKTVLEKVNERLRMKANVTMDIDSQTEREGVVYVYIDEWVGVGVYWGERDVDGIIKGKKDCVCYDVMTVKHIPATRHDPPDCEEYEVGTFYGVDSTALQMTQIYRENEVALCFEWIYESRMADEEEEYWAEMADEEEEYWAEMERDAQTILEPE
jgi:hypothetical protein